MGGGKYSDMMVENVLKIDTDYLLWTYYTQSNLSFMDDILDELKITGDRRIVKPGKDVKLFFIVKDSNLRDLEGVDKYKKLAKEKRKVKAKAKKMLFKHEHNDKILFSKSALAKRNGGIKGFRLDFGPKPQL